MRLRRELLAAAFLFVLHTAASAQSLEIGGHVASSQWGEFDGTDIGVGARVTFKPVPLIGVDAELTWYPGDFPPDGIPFSRGRMEGMFGATVGPRMTGFRPFVKAAGGFLNITPTDRPFPCIAIYPPPLSCQMASGDTLPAFELGGGVELDATARTFIRADVTARLLKYPGPTLDRDFERHDDAFFAGALRFTIGGGFRF